MNRDCIDIAAGHPVHKRFRLQLGRPKADGVATDILKMMTEPLVLLNSEASRFATGVNLFVDYSYTGQVFCEQRPGLL